ncbi:MAG: SDR family NAD(P)-dependent oxidoreductase [Solirubrobacterales bacterium]
MSENASVEGKTIVITGASDGIGAVAARELKDAGANVIITGRNPEKTKRVADEVGSPALIADFADFEQVRRLADEITAVAPKIDVLANNAGGMFKVRQKTKDGHEPNFQINHLSPFLLTHLLKPLLLASDERRIINTASMANNYGHVFMGHLDSHKSENIAYGTGKLMNILFTRGIARKWADENFVSAALHPGVVQSKFGRDSFFVRMAYNNPIANRIMITNEQGATPIIDLVSREPRDEINGVFFMRHKANGHENKQAKSQSIQDALWDESERLVGL